VRCTHTYEQTNSSLDWVLSHWAHFTGIRKVPDILCGSVATPLIVVGSLMMNLLQVC